jgi:hypothetical protein
LLLTHPPLSPFYVLDDPLRHWHKGKFEAALEPQKVNYSNLNKNSSLQNLMVRKILDAGPSTLMSPIGFCPFMK